MRTIEVPAEAFDRLEAAEDPEAVAADLLPHPKVREGFAKCLLASVYHCDTKALGQDRGRFRALFGVDLTEPTWSESADSSGETLQRLSRAHLLSAYGGRLLRSDERMRARVDAAATLDDLLISFAPGRPPSIASLRQAWNEFAGLGEMNDPKVRYGRLEAFFETGTEGVIWSLHDDIGVSYAGLYPVHTGDLLEVYSEDGTVTWSGAVKLERKRGRHRLGDYEQQAIYGMWVHGFNEEQTPEAWADMFFGRRRARLVCLSEASSGRQPCAHIEQVWD